MSDRPRLLALLRELSWEDRDVVLKSGRTSRFYVDVRNTALHPEGMVLLGRALFGAIQGGPAVAAVAGPSIGADPLVSAVTYTSWLQSTPIPGLLVRPEAKGHGTARRLEGTRNVPAGSAVAVVEDVLTSGGSVLRTVAALREAGYAPVCVVAVVDRQEGGREAIEATGLPVAVLFTRRDIAGDAG